MLMRKIKGKIKTFFLAGYSVKLLISFVIGWFLLKLNSLIIVILPQIASNSMKLVFQISWLLILILIVRSSALFRNITNTKLARKDLQLLALSWFGMLAISILLGYLSTQLGMMSTNQRVVLSILDNTPVFSFVLYLIAASILEEIIYRETLFGLSQISIIDIVLTSLLFSLHHNPNTFLVFITYFTLGMFLGTVRQRSSLLASIILHIIWNMTALAWALWF